MNCTRVVFRIPELQDAPAYVSLKNSLVDEDGDVDINTYTTVEHETSFIEGYRRRVKEGRMAALAVEVDGEVVGHGHISSRSGKMSHVGILGLFIHSRHRDHGIGTELIERLEEQARGNGVESVILEVFASNTRAIHVYEKLGYGHVGVYSDALKRGEGYTDCVLMQKTL